MRRRNRIKKREEKGAPRWMVTYSDLMTLILVFFILLFSMSQIDLVKFEAISESFRNRMIFDFYPSPVEMDNPTEKTDPEENGEQSNEFENPTNEVNTTEHDAEDDHSQKEHELDQLVEEVDTFLDNNQLNDVISANRTDRGVVLVLQEQLLFESAEAEVLESGKPFLSKVGTLLKNIPNDITVEGHTDDRPISTFRYPSNWELSGARASSVIRYIIGETSLERERFSAVAYGDTRPAAPNDSPENWGKNRRVEIVILDPA
ncbi:chemotaxis protein MotB [Thalassobacillus cyri]|uniref:Chemotaxis protein MotB n=1 Tax=Thalassobacillus cyri TaxID=571932 RepID=A0A1H4BI97_9BACI|nr:flagellar motor protein MotS [Thalassobacillus cyri]SEA47764.1 chemotaxis protein MotB [Thalassobacillus cyri]